MLVVGPDSPEVELQYVGSMLAGGTTGATRPKIDPAVDIAFWIYSVSARTDHLSRLPQQCRRYRTVYHTRWVVQNRRYRMARCGWKPVHHILFKDLSKFKGFQISPAEIENVLHGHPLVHDVAVIGLAVQNIVSEIPVAYVVIEKTRKPTQQVAEELLAYVSGKLAPHKRLRGGIIPISEIPKSASGKI
ncbi:AMP-dependent synthetase/ligase [Penicillium cf. griseofulvum]|uniref:AMP-dependent synthetase/ligase n=1 Tax=Penicillium cf. griseofulvum TaxID=2972120 RepID=A0A9W9MGG2_9EURO|nr:AMP-dependent synthetase/ligase [Penicillium cf. griseofulvum]KAJ5423148.1 AMP-dependent synthetase/ligase [Penicillium cf. griseofulvum]KAJ5431586.1 AMP-dependent synthetase/ligase [Penicillium cf. griseofulvum]